MDARKGEEKKLKSFVNQEKMTALNYAAFYGKLDIVDFLLSEGAGKPCVRGVTYCGLGLAMCQA